MVQPRRATPTVKVDEYCQWYKTLFSDVRSFDAFKYLHIECVSDLKCKTLPARAKIVGLDNHQGLHHFFTLSSWSVEELMIRRLELIFHFIKKSTIHFNNR
jgi:SRSO17 transposase